MADDPRGKGLATFGVLWLGQMVSLLGSGMTAFALGVWAYQRTGSVTEFGIITFCSVAPVVLLAPLAGSLVDRWDRRHAMMASDSLGALSSVGLLLLHTTHGLELWHVYVGVSVSALATSLQEPAFAAATTVLLPEQHLGRASAMLQFAQAVGRTLAPPVAGMMLMSQGLTVVMVVDVCTFVVAITSQFLVRVPPPARSAEGEQQAQAGLLSELSFGLRYIFARRGLLALIGFFSIINLTLGLAEVLVTPLVLKMATPAVLGRVLACCTLGMVTGSVLMTLWGGPRRRILGIVCAGTLYGVSLALSGLHPSIPLICVAGFALMFFNPPIASCSQALWQSRVPPDLQGRVFAVRSALAWASAPVAYIVGGPLADRVFEPMMARDGALAPLLGGLLGVGPGRGIALLLVVLGGMALLASLVLFLLRPVRALDAEPAPASEAEPMASPT